MEGGARSPRRGWRTGPPPHLGLRICLGLSLFPRGRFPLTTDAAGSDSSSQLSSQGPQVPCVRPSVSPRARQVVKDKPAQERGSWKAELVDKALSLHKTLQGLAQPPLGHLNRQRHSGLQGPQLWSKSRVKIGVRK